MKRIIIIMAVGLFAAVSANAQRYLPGQTGIELTGGLADGLKFKKEDGQALYGNISMSTYNKKGNRWVFGAEYYQRQYKYRDGLIPAVQITAEGGHYFKLLSDPGKNVFLSVGGSALAGYETLNWGDKMLRDGATIIGKDGFVYGGALSAEIETFITDKVVFLIRVRERAMFGSSISHFHFQVGAGIKFIIH